MYTHRLLYPVFIPHLLPHLQAIAFNHLWRRRATALNSASIVKHNHVNAFLVVKAYDIMLKVMVFVETAIWLKEENSGGFGFKGEFRWRCGNFRGFEDEGTCLREGDDV